jgi:hypothetical protein
MSDEFSNDDDTRDGERFRVFRPQDLPEDCTLDAADLWLMRNDPEWNRRKYR